MHNALAVERRHTAKMILSENLDIEIWATVDVFHNHIAVNVGQLIVRLESLAKYGKG